MRRRLAGPTIWCLVALALGACYPRTDPGGQPSAGGGATVVYGEDLTSSGVLLDALAHRVQSLRVGRLSDGCPLVVVRGQALGRNIGSAVIYVDGTRMSDTCILQQIAPSEVDRVELYAVASGRPEGYVAGIGGLILVFLRH